jgi:hypothetical protein
LREISRLIEILSFFFIASLGESADSERDKGDDSS